MFYAIISQDVENSLDKRLTVRAEHIERLNTLQDEGRLLICLLYTSPSPRDQRGSRMPSSA